MNWYSKDIKLSEYKLLFVFVIIYRILVLAFFGSHYTDSDQSIMWLGAVDYSHLDFFEPRFYGQDYNTMLESFLAVPLLKIGIPHHISLPIVTNILSIFPFWIISKHFLRKGLIANALIVLLVFITLPIEYDLITNLPRGFVTGLFISGFVYYYAFINQHKFKYFMVGFLSLIAFSINPNSVVFNLPIIFYIWIEGRYKIFSFYIFILCGILIGTGVHILIQSFYKINPNYNIYSYDFSYSLQKFIIGIKRLDLFFNNLVPFFNNKGWLVFVLFGFFGIFFYVKKKYSYLMTIIISLIMIIAPLTLNKVHAGAPSIFYPASRMYLAVPLLFSFFIGGINLNIKKYNRIIVYVICFSFCVFKLANIKPTVNLTIEKGNSTVSILKTKAFIKDCKTLNQICKKNKIELVVIVDHYYYDFYNYGCPACEEKFPQTIRPVFERRTWVLVKCMPKIYHNILFVDLNNSINISEQNKIESDIQGLYIIKRNNLATKELFLKLKINVRPY